MPMVPGANAASCVVVPKVPTAAVSTEPIIKFGEVQDGDGCCKGQDLGS